MTQEELNNLYAQQCQVLGDLYFKLQLTKEKMTELQNELSNYQEAITTITNNIHELNKKAKEVKSETTSN